MRSSIIAVFITCSLWACKPHLQGDVLISNVNIVDVESGNILSERDVLLSGNTISAVIAHGEQRINADKVIDGNNKFLLPGLWDMHIHMMRNRWFESQLPLLRANGITGFREMWGDLGVIRHVRSMMANDSLPFFRFYAPGHILDGKVPFWPHAMAVPDAERASHLVDSLMQADADFIKVYSYLTPETFHAIAARCKEKKIPFVGHVPHTMRVTEASRAGMHSMEHLYGLLTEACESDSAYTLQQQAVDAFESGNKHERKQINLTLLSLLLKRFSPDKLRAVCRELKKNNTHIVPTLALLKGIYFLNDTSFTNDERIRFMSTETREYWKEVTSNDLNERTEAEWKQLRARWELEKQIMKMLIDEGVAIMAGTDADNAYVFPGFSLHDELALYVECGMKPIDALRSATLVPVRFLNLSDSLGSVTKNKLADLLIVDGNPLIDIATTKNVHAVIANGKVYDKAYIHEVLNRAEH